MSRTVINLAVDLAAAALFAGMAATGYVIAFAMPPGTNRSLILWGMTRHQWGSIHLWVSFALLAVLLLHVCLHWPWVVSTLGKRLGLPSAKGGLLRTAVPTLLALAAVTGLFAWATRAGVREISGDAGRHGVCPPPGAQGERPAETGSWAEEPREVGFWEDVYPVLERSCLRCHGPSRQAAGFRIDRREDYFGAGGRAPQVVPGDSAGSPLIAVVSGRRTGMARADAHRLPEKDVALLRAWIDAGARWPEKPDGR